MAGQAARDSGPAAARAGRQPEVLRMLQAARAPLSIAEIASALGVHPNTVRFHLEALVRGGRAQQAPARHSRPGRPPLLYQAVRRMDPAGPRSYRLLAGILADSLAALPEPGARAVEAGRASGRRLARLAGDGSTSGAAAPDSAHAPEPVGRLVSLMDELGFAPETRVAAGQAQVLLRHCPFLELAEVKAQVVCPIHLGLMQGAMAAWEAPVTVQRLDPLAEPDLCVAHLAAAGAAS
ncbi:MAG: helix-turn-helix transcriptional regulator [Streptosporangiaceae bacterium]